MWFNNAIVYQYEGELPQDLNVSFEEERLKPCPAHARFTYGWMPVIDNLWAHEVAGCVRFCLGKEERLLPRSVIQSHLAERIKNLEIQRGYSVKRAEKAQITEDLEFELLPQAFCIQKRLFAYLDTVKKRLIINTSSQTQSIQLLALLRKSLPTLRFEPLHYPENLAQRFTQWMSDPHTLPSHLQLSTDCLLFSPNDDKKRLTCKGYEQPSEEIMTLITQGLLASEVSFIWKERIQLTLTHDFTFKRMKCLDYLLDDFQDIRQLEDDMQQLDASLILLSGEWRVLLDDLCADVHHDISNDMIEQHVVCEI